MALDIATIVEDAEHLDDAVIASLVQDDVPGIFYA